MAESHGTGRRRTCDDGRLRGGFGELDGIDQERTRILIGKRRVDGRLKSDLRHGTLERDADIGRGVHGPDGLGRRSRHHEAPRTLGLRGYFGEGAVIIGGRLLHEGRKGRLGLGRRGVVVRYGVERALGAGGGFRKREGCGLGRELRRGEVPADDKVVGVIESEDRERRERGFPCLGFSRRVEEGAGVGIVSSGERDGDPGAVRSFGNDGIDCFVGFVARGEQGGRHGGRSKKNLFHEVIKELNE